MSAARLNEIGHLLMSAGSDNARMTLNTQDAALLGLVGNTEEITEETAYMDVGADGKMVSKKRTTKTQAVISQLVNDRVHTYDVNVGVARKALNEKLGGKPIEGCRPSDNPAPPPVEEEQATA